MRQSYTTYRDSGVDWLGRIPEHWQDQRLKTTVERSDIRVEPAQLETAPYVGLEHVASQTGRLLALDDEQEPTGLSNAFACGDVLFGKLRPYLAKAFCAEFDGLCSTEFLILRPERYERRYLLHLLLTNGFVSHVDSSTFGARMPRTDWEFVGDSVLPVPPQREQAAIAGYLDSEAARIDRLIRMQESLIERLDEYRTALVTWVVTKGLPPEAAEAAGLDPEPALKDSGVQWLGEVPEHWEIKALCRAVIFQRGHDLPNDERESGTVPVVSSAGISGRHAEAAAIGPAIVTGRYGSIGEFYVIDGPFWPLNTSLYSIDLGSNDVMFLLFMLRSLKPLFIANAAKSAVPGVDRNDIHGIQVALPDRDEQIAIADYLTTTSDRIDTLRAKAELSIERLSEYRLALISAAVTGKIDVREAALAGAGGGV